MSLSEMEANGSKYFALNSEVKAQILRFRVYSD